MRSQSRGGTRRPGLGTASDTVTSRATWLKVEWSAITISQRYGHLHVHAGLLLELQRAPVLKAGARQRAWQSDGTTASAWPRVEPPVLFGHPP